jgi:cellulase/cellobiase CelA1
MSYGQAIASALGVAHFVIDTSRNGLGPDASGAWCNPAGRALGAAPAASTDHRLDWNLWIHDLASPTAPATGTRRGHLLARVRTRPRNPRNRLAASYPRPAPPT